MGMGFRLWYASRLMKPYRQSTYILVSKPGQPKQLTANFNRCPPAVVYPCTPVPLSPLDL